VADFNFVKLSDDARLRGSNVINDISMYLILVSPRRASRDAGTDVIIQVQMPQGFGLRADARQRISRGVVNTGGVHVPGVCWQVTQGAIPASQILL